MLKTIADLGPEKALRQQDYYWQGMCQARYKRNRNTRDILDLAGIAKAMGVNKLKVKNLLKDTRQILRDMFNRDGCLFVSE
jgi:thiamine pyrophosphate-dependent acetolactate synthase large subunit-like protein